MYVNTTKVRVGVNRSECRVCCFAGLRVASGVVALAPAALAVLKHLNLHTQTHTTDSKMVAGEGGRQSHASTAQGRAGRDQRQAAQQRDTEGGRDRLSQTDRQTDNTVKSDQSATVSPPPLGDGWMPCMTRPPARVGWDGGESRGGRERDTPHRGQAGQHQPRTAQHGWLLSGPFHPRVRTARHGTARHAKGLSWAGSFAPSLPCSISPAGRQASTHPFQAGSQQQKHGWMHHLVSPKKPRSLSLGSSPESIDSMAGDRLGSAPSRGKALCVHVYGSPLLAPPSLNGP